MIAHRRMLLSRRGLSPAAFVVLGAAIAFPAAAIAQPDCELVAPGSTPARQWAAPLDRVIGVRLRNVSLRDGLDRIAVASRVRISYSAELLPLDRRVCLAVDAIAAGDVLAELLSGTGVEPVTTGSDQIVLAPAPTAGRPPQAMAGPVQTLERVVVMGSPTGDAQRPLAVAPDVLDGKPLADQRSSSLASTFDGGVPGLWVWEQSPTSLLARYGSIRGASSFGVSYPKVYIDGIEVANPLLVTDLNPAVLDHVEVIRGPQGAALYGADAISGVVNIVTRHDGTQSGADHTEAASGAGFSQSDYATRSVFAQNHALTWRSGSNTRSGTLALSLSTLGGYVPQASSRDLKVNGAMNVVTSKAAFTSTARVYAKQAAVGENPLLRGSTQSGLSLPISMSSRERTPTSARPDTSRARLLPQDTLPESVNEYTVGETMTLFTSGHWTPTFVAGLDGYRLANVPNDLPPASSATDTALHAARGGADRGTLRATLIGHYDLARRESLTLTFAAEHSTLRETEAGGPVITSTGSSVPGARIASDLISWRHNSGVIAQGNLAIADALYLTGGLRLERTDGFTAASQTALLPMFGAATVHDIGAATVKLRGAYGRGIRPVQARSGSMAIHDVPWKSGANLQAEEQSGTELGVDLLFGRQAVHITRFDQRAFGLIQLVSIRDSQPSSAGTPSSDSHRLGYVLQNVGEIANRGWEMESAVRFGSLSLAGTLSLVDSRVRRIARAYSGDLQEGSRMLAVPARSASLSASWTQMHWMMTIAASRASDWINYDRLRIAQVFADSVASPQAMVGARLRNYWVPYSGVTRLRATLSRDLSSNVSLKITGDNLTNAQRGEPDNVTVLPGRTLILGLNAAMR